MRSENRVQFAPAQPQAATIDKTHEDDYEFADNIEK